MATEDPMHVMAASGIRGGLNMGDNVRSSAGAGISPSPVHDSVAQELGMLLRSHSRLDSVLSRRDMGPHRSGSAPPSVEGSLALMGGLLGGDPRGRLTTAGSGDNNNDIIDSEQELRSDPAYLAYYYSHVNRNPRLPPPLVTRENYLLAQRLAVSGLGDKRKLRSFDDSNGRSLFSSQQTLPTHNEEPESSEDERSPMGNLLRHASDNWSERGALDGPPGFPNPYLGTKPKSLVDLIQEDFPRTPSPVFNQSCVSNDDGVNGAALTAASVAELSASLLGSRSATPSVVLASRSATPNPALNSRSATPNPVLSSRSATPNPSIAHMIGSSGVTSSVSSGPVARASTPDPSAADISGFPGNSNISLSQTKGMAGRNAPGSAELAAALQSLSLSNVPVEQQDSHLSVQSQQQAIQFNQRPLGSQAQSQIPQSQIFAQALHHHQQQQQQLSGLESSHRAQARYGLQNPQLQNSILQSGAANNAYAAAAAAMSYMAANPYYQNLQAYAPHYGVGGYPINPALIPALMANYPNPVAYDTAAAAAAAAAATLAAGMGPRAPISGSSNGMGFDMHPIYRYTGQAGASMQSYLQDPLYYQYLLQYSSSDSLELQRNYLNSMLGYPTEQKAELSRSGSVGVPAGGKSAAMNPLYYGSHGFVMPYTHSPISSPVLPGSPVATAPFSFRQAERNYRFASGVGRTSAGGIHMGWHGQKGSDTGDESKGSSLLEELKNNKTRRFELADILGHVVEFSADQHGSRFIQQKLETVSLEEKASVFQEVLPHALTLMTDVFGNYVIQKFFEHGTAEQRSELADHLVGHVLNLSLQMYGCRVIQKALEVVDVEKQVRLVSELDGHVMRCVRDQNGNHVIQKCIECVPPEHINFIISAFYGQVVILSMHPYGCRVIQRVLEHCTDEQKQNGIMEEILSSVCTLAQDQYGNYVVQHILEHGEQRERSEILTKLAGQIVQMSQHKFASNVVEKCLEFGGPVERQILITEMLGQTDENEPLQAMMKDQYANYVVQKVLETCDDQQRELLLSRIKVHLHALKRYTYGKHIVARVEKLVATGERHGTQVS